MSSFESDLNGSVVDFINTAVHHSETATTDLSRYLKLCLFIKEIFIKFADWLVQFSSIIYDFY